MILDGKKKENLDNKSLIVNKYITELEECNKINKNF